MLTHEFAMAGFRANPSDSLWELVDTVDWDRFSATTPDNLYWNHFGGFPLREWTIKLKSNPDNQFPTMQSKIVKWYGFRKNNSIIINRLVKILEQDILENQM
jgi:hypothetical protein